MRDLYRELRRRLTPAQSAALDALLAAAGRPLYLVGGSVRDLILRRPGLDVDLVLEGPAIELAEAFAARTGASVRRHAAFGTATVWGPGFRFDLVTARQETYRRPGALPTVRPATLMDDLARRDFTINAMALRLTPPDAPERDGRLVDPFGGLADLEARLVRVLHPASFRDDATRMLRAVRYAGRLGFRLEPGTLALLERDRAYLETISGARIRHEIERMLEEEEPEALLRRCDELGLLAAVDPALRFGPREAEAYRLARREVPDEARPLVCWAALALEASAEEAARIAARLHLTGRQTAALTCVPEVTALAGALAEPGLRPSRAAALLDGRPPACLWAVALARRDAAADVLRRYLTAWRHVRPHLTGHDLAAMGVPEGPRMGEILRQLRHARLDGEVRSAADERALVARLLAPERQDG